MFEPSVLISLIVSILIFFFTIYITFKKELDDLKTESQKNMKKIHARQNMIKFLKIITFILLLFVLLLFYIPSIINLINNGWILDFEPINLSSIGDFFIKLVPFKKGFFDNTNFKFSYITGIVFSIIIVLIWFIELDQDIIFPCFASEYMLQILIIVSLAYGLIWANNYISIFLSYCIIHCFAFLSIVFNLIIYVIIFTIITLIIYIFE